MFGKLANMKLLLSSRKLLERQVFLVFCTLVTPWVDVLCAGANVNLKEKRLAIYGKGYNDSLKFRKMKKYEKDDNVCPSRYCNLFVRIKWGFILHCSKRVR